MPRRGPAKSLGIKRIAEEEVEGGIGRTNKA
jgi:hypothetical protein